MRYIIILIIFIFSFNIAFAQEPVQFFDKVDQKIIGPVKRMIDSMKQKGIDQKGQEAMEKAQENIKKTVKEKQEELLDKAEEKIKQEVKEGTRNWFENRKRWVERKLAPLKIKIQEGSDLIRGWIEKVKEYFK